MRSPNFPHFLQTTKKKLINAKSHTLSLNIFKPQKKIHNKDINSFLSMINGSGNETMSGIFFSSFTSCSFWQRHRIFVTFCDQYRGWPRDLCSNYNKPVDWMDHTIGICSTSNWLIQPGGWFDSHVAWNKQRQRQQRKKSKTNTKLVKFAKEATLNDKRFSVLCAAFTLAIFSSQLGSCVDKTTKKNNIIIKSINFCP